MKASFKIISMIVALLILFQTFAYADENRKYADALYELGLFSGTDKGYELDKTFTREEAVTVIVRLLGEADKLDGYGFTEKFTDVKRERWSFKYVMYCYENGITYGTGENTFSPEETIDSYQFVTLLLRVMGYEDTKLYESLDDAVKYQLFNSDIAEKITDEKNLKREDMVYILYRSLKTKTADGELFANCLEKRGVITAKEAAEFDVYNDFENIDELLEELLN